MPIVDAQLHEPGPWLDWDDTNVEIRDNVLTEALFATMDAVGVERVLLFPSIANEAWAEALAVDWPQRFAMVPRFKKYGNPGEDRALDPEAPDIERQIAVARGRPGVRALRFVVTFPRESLAKFESGAWDRALRACEQQQIPIFLFASGRLDLVATIAQTYPELAIVIDHMGLRLRALPEVVDTPPWKALPQLLELAEFPNLAVKMCGVPSLSAEPYPFRDCWDHVRRIVDAFGASRLMWASDIGRFRGRVGWHWRASAERIEYVGQHTYAESLGFYRNTDLLTGDEKRWILGESVCRLLDW